MQQGQQLHDLPGLIAHALSRHSIEVQANLNHVISPNDGQTHQSASSEAYSACDLADALRMLADIVASPGNTTLITINQSSEREHSESETHAAKVRQLKDFCSHLQRELAKAPAVGSSHPPSAEHSTAAPPVPPPIPPSPLTKPLQPASITQQRLPPPVTEQAPLATTAPPPVPPPMPPTCSLLKPYAPRSSTRSTPRGHPQLVTTKYQEATKNLAGFLARTINPPNPQPPSCPASHPTQPPAPYTQLTTPKHHPAPAPPAPPLPAGLTLIPRPAPQPSPFTLPHSAPQNCTLVHKRWHITHLKPPSAPINLYPRSNQSVHIHDCHSATIIIHGPIAALFIDSCTDLQVTCSDVIAYCQAVTCGRLSLTASGTVSTISFDQCQSARLVLQPPAHHARIVTTLCTDTQAQKVVSSEALGWKSLGLLKVPEQFVSTCSGTGLHTRPYRPY